MKILYNTFCLLALAAIVSSCSEDAGLAALEERLTAEQQALIGQKVSFDASLSTEFDTRTSYNTSGSFNEQDLMRIYRQYWNATDGKWDEEVFRTYYYYSKMVTGTSIVLNNEWKVLAERTGQRSTYDENNQYQSSETFIQTDADSLTWENGRTVRYRAWARSNYSGTLYSTSKRYYYPDFSISDWVTVSGPTLSIPLTLKHLGCRIVVTPKAGNQMNSVEVATDWQDYKYLDNNTTTEKDEADAEHGKTDDAAQNECNSVMAVYNKMCMPAGVDMEQGALMGMTQSYYNTATDFKQLEDAPDDAFYKYGTNTGAYIKESVQRPVFNTINGACYLISIPYDMSDDANTQGETLVLPACTRFRVYLYDVNKGDENQSTTYNGKYEGKYHIFALSDIKNTDGTPKFPNGLELRPGYSYTFTVGYQYNNLTITADDSFAWEEESDTELETPNQDGETPSVAQYEWWRQAIHNAIPKTSSQSYDPVFHITSKQEFLEFIHLVNGTATTKTSGLERAIYEKKNGDKEVKWYSGITFNAQGGRDTIWVTREEAEAQGYIFYDHYYVAVGTQAAGATEDYLRGPFPFYDDNLNRSFKVYLDQDLDFEDILLTTIGQEANSAPFRGQFDACPPAGTSPVSSQTIDGEIHTLRNIRMTDEYLFGYVQGAAIRNLRIESQHNVSLLNKAIGINYIVGIALYANSTTNPIAQSIGDEQDPMTSYVVGCIHVGDCSGALVGTAGNLKMYGCMQAAAGISGGALLGEYSSYKKSNFFAPQSNPKKLQWGNFHCNYYDTELSPQAHAVGSTADAYAQLEYIRGRASHILKAKNDNLLSDEVDFSTLSDYRKKEFYGLAPWKAMNYGIYKYNSSLGESSPNTCNAHYEQNSVGYTHEYPALLTGKPNETEYAKILFFKLNN